jgi:hypothetical protein
MSARSHMSVCVIYTYTHTHTYTNTHSYTHTSYRACVIVVPDLHGPVRRARDEDVRVEFVPRNRIHSHVVSLELLDVCGRVERTVEAVDGALFGTHHEQPVTVGVCVEVEAGASVRVCMSV